MRIFSFVPCRFVRFCSVLYEACSSSFCFQFLSNKIYLFQPTLCPKCNSPVQFSKTQICKSILCVSLSIFISFNVFSLLSKSLSLYLICILQLLDLVPVFLYPFFTVFYRYYMYYVLYNQAPISLSVCLFRKSKACRVWKQ